ncbi:type II toxin-antitoxin system VapB family antitoxin [Desertivirga xinjiangensis]|uniref:type II toxin-antitoxin system VapB family antitoxin n=1 Tax=Desertivirga xinjiangensis TaxID=539206 RepID=UPI00210D920B|nr:DUF2281 domain-containing protein [Pedobacter xinjiangensis]
MNSWLIYTKLNSLPDTMKTQVADFIDFLESKAKKGKTILSKPKPQFGSARGMFVMRDDFDDPIEDFKDYM